MRTHMECRSLGENKSNYSTVESVRQIRQQNAGGSTMKSKKKSSGGQIVAGLAVGAAAGVIAGMLFAPEKGEHMRRKVSKQASKLGDQVNKGYSSTKDKVSSWTNKSASGNAQGIKKPSPYTDSSKWDSQENKNMTNTARNTPGV